MLELITKQKENSDKGKENNVREGQMKVDSKNKS